MNKADIYIKETLLEILDEGQWDKNPRTKWSDGTPAHSKFVTQKSYSYDISKGHFPITTLRKTALKGAWHDIEAIYLKQTNILEEMDKSIWSWWKDFTHKKLSRDKNNYTFNRELLGVLKSSFKKNDFSDIKDINSLGQTYGNTVKRYNLVDKLLKGLEENPFGRRHKMNLWQEQQVIDDPQALEPCAGMTLWSVREEESDRILDYSYIGKSNGSPIYETIRYIDLTLIQRSQDFVVTASINPAQYTMLAMMICNHLTFKTGTEHEVGKLLHIVQNVHYYDRHEWAVKEILDRIPTRLQPKIKLTCEPKDFYEHKWEDFKVSGLEGIEKLSNQLEIAI